MDEMKPNQLVAWIEAEGNIGAGVAFKHSRLNQFSPEVGITQKDLAILQTIQRAVGAGKIYPYSKGKKYHCFSLKFRSKKDLRKLIEYLASTTQEDWLTSKYNSFILLKEIMPEWEAHTINNKISDALFLKFLKLREMGGGKKKYSREEIEVAFKNRGYSFSEFQKLPGAGFGRGKQIPKLEC
jgi:hypothetical protein